jgi:hypothetical protein
MSVNGRRNETTVMNAPRSKTRQALAPNGWWGTFAASASLALFCLQGDCLGQGTMTVTFEGPAYPGGPQPQPPGTYSIMSQYSESGMLFNADAAYTMLLVGSGLSGNPDNGTAYLENDAAMTVSFPSGIPFSLTSIDAAALPLGGILHVVGYRRDGTTVANDFLPWAGGNFQTLQFSSGFGDLDHLYVSGGWALDNLVVGIPEPSAGMLMLLWTLATLGWWRARGNGPSCGSFTK